MTKLTKAQAGRLGGLATLAKYGPEHMRSLAKLGARAFWQKYTLRPIGPNDFLIIDRTTGEPIAKTMNGEHLPPRRTTT